MTFAGVMLDKAACHPRAIKKITFAIGDDEHPVGAQLIGTEPDTLAAAAVNLQKIGYDLIDLNFACPAPKVLKRGRGGFLLNSPETIIRICRQVRQSVDCPLLAKLRIGYGAGQENRDKFWCICENLVACGIDALIVHGRTVLQRFRQTADWQVLAEVKKAFGNTIIIGSGDLFDAETICRHISETGIDAVAIARGAIGNPWIFQETAALLVGRPLPPPPSIQQQGEVIAQHFDMACRLYEPRKAVLYFRKFGIRYCKRHPQRKFVQKDLLAAQTAEQVCSTIAKWYDIEPN